MTQRQRKPWDGLPDLIEDNRHSAMQLRRWISKQDAKVAAVSSRILVDAAAAAQQEMRDDLDGEDQAVLKEAGFLVSQFEEAMVFLSSLEIV